MDEGIVASKLIEEAKSHGNVIEIDVDVGELAGIKTENLKATLESLVDWKVNVSEEKAVCKCPCGFEGWPKIIDSEIRCPECSETPKLLSGDRIVLDSVKTE